MHRGLFKVSEQKVTWENGRVWRLAPTTGELVYIPLLITDTDTGKARFDSKVMVEIVKLYDGGSVDVRSPTDHRESLLRASFKTYRSVTFRDLSRLDEILTN